MSDAKPSPVLRLLPSLTDVAFLLPIVFLFAPMDGVKSMLGDGDTGYHIRAGEWILQNGSVPYRDMFSFTKPGEPWYAWEWLWEAAFAWLHQRGGMAWVVLASILVIAMTFALLFRLARRKCSNAFIAIGVTLVAAAASSIHWLARPHLFSLLFLVIFLSWADRAAAGETRRLWWLLPLTVVWTNIHGAFILGIAILGCYAAGALVSWLVEPDTEIRLAARARFRQFSLAGLGCAAVSFINPYTYHLHRHIYQFLSERYHFENISEYQPVNFHYPPAQFIELMLVLGMAAVLWSVLRKRFAEAILLVLFLHGGLIAARNVPVYAIAAAPLVAAMLREMVELLLQAPVAGWVRRAIGWFKEFAAEFGALDRAWRLHVMSAAGFAMLCMLVNADAKQGKLRAEYDPKKYPAKALEVLRSLPQESRIFTDDEWGDYLIYRLYPERKVFVDGRCDFYGEKFGEKYIHVMSARFGWEEHLQRYGIDAILLPVRAALSGVLKESRRWRVVYDDGVAIVFRPATGGQLGATPRTEPGAASSAGKPDFVARGLRRPGGRS